MREQFLRGLVFMLVIILMTSDMKLMADLASSETLGTVLGFIAPSSGGGKSPKNPQGERIPENNADDPVLQVAISNTRNKIENSNQISTNLNDEEKDKLSKLKAHLTSVMQQYCLPFVICELHASINERNNLSDAERGILNIIRETSLGTMGEVLSRYHFAAHMGQLLQSVDTNGCQNLYAGCPLNKFQVLEMVKKVKIK